MKRNNLRLTFTNGELIILNQALIHVKRISIKESYIWNSSFIINNINNIANFSNPEEIKPGNYTGEELAAVLQTLYGVYSCSYEPIAHMFSMTIVDSLDLSRNPSLANVLGFKPQVYPVGSHTSSSMASLFTTPYYLVEIPQVYANIMSNDEYREYYDIIQNDVPLMSLMHQKNDPADFNGKFYEYPYCERKVFTALKINIYDQFRNLVDFNGKKLTFVFDVEYH